MRGGMVLVGRGGCWKGSEEGEWGWGGLMEICVGVFRMVKLVWIVRLKH